MVDVSIGIEDIEPAHWVAWVFEIPGCYASGPTPEPAIAGVPDAYIKETGAEQDVTCVVAERSRAVPADDDPDILVNAFFEDDRRPLTVEDIRDGMARLHAQRADLLELVTTVDLAERDDIAAILTHIVRAERWFLRCVGVDLDVPDTDVTDQLAFLREQLVQRLPSFAGVEFSSDVGGERFSPRKLLRRAVWHERDHMQQIRRMVA